MLGFIDLEITIDSTANLMSLGEKIKKKIDFIFFSSFNVLNWIMKVLNFTSKNKNGLEVLSNFYKGKLKINNNWYSCGENAFHGEKYLYISLFQNYDRKEELEKYGKKFQIEGEYGHLNPSEIKKKGGKNGMMLDCSELELWYKGSMNVQRQICEEKLKNDEKVKNELIKSGNNILVHPSRVNDDKIRKLVWNGRGKKVDGKIEIIGGNKLGEIWMELRSKL